MLLLINKDNAHWILFLGPILTWKVFCSFHTVHLFHKCASVEYYSKHVGINPMEMTRNNLTWTYFWSKITTQTETNKIFRSWHEAGKNTEKHLRIYSTLINPQAQKCIWRTNWISNQVRDTNLVFVKTSRFVLPSLWCLTKRANLPRRNNISINNKNWSKLDHSLNVFSGPVIHKSAPQLDLTWKQAFGIDLLSVLQWIT